MSTKKEQPLISVIIPAYNIEKYIERCVESVRQQNYTNLQIIIINDGSTDQTGKILDNLAKKDFRIKVLHNSNEGVSAARNAGLDVADGEYIGFVDGDDYIETVMYEKLIELVETYNADIAHCGYQMVFPDRVDLYYGTEQLKIQDRTTGIKDLIEGTFVEPGLWNKLYSKRVLSELRLDPAIKINEDLLLNYFAFSKSRKAVFYDKPYYHYMIRKNSASTSDWNKSKLLDPVIVLETMYEVEKQEELKNIIGNRYVYQLMRTVIFQSKKNSKELKELKKELRRKLEIELKKNKDNLAISRRNYLLGKMAVTCPWGTRTLHQIYSSILGTKNKYKV